MFKKERVYKKCNGQILPSAFPFLRKGDTFAIMVSPGKFFEKEGNNEEMVAASDYGTTIKGDGYIDIVDFGRYIIVQK